jgi:hypothetical protein
MKNHRLSEIKMEATRVVTHTECYLASKKITGSNRPAVGSPVTFYFEVVLKYFDCPDFRILIRVFNQFLVLDDLF